MKLFYIFTLFFLLIGGLFSVNAQDLIILRDGNVIEAKVTEITPTEIKYRRFNHLNGPVIVIARADVSSIRYENKTVEIINPASVAGEERNRPGQPQNPQPDTPAFPQSDQTLLQQVLNRMPAIPIAGNNLKFEFRGNIWISRVNGEDFSTGTIEYEKTGEGFILTLQQTHIWPGAVGKTAGKTAGRVANLIPGGGAVGGALNSAGNAAGAVGDAVGAVEAPGLVIILEYKAGPPASLKFVSSSQNDTANTRAEDNQSEDLGTAKNNWISYNFGVLGGSVKYERMLTPKISLGANIGYNMLNLFFENDPFQDIAVGADAAFRFYPGKIFYLGLAVGFYYVNDVKNWYSLALGIIPEIGWRWDVGKKGGFFIQLALAASFLFGEKIWDDPSINPEEFGFIAVYPRAFFGLGYAF